MKINKLAFFAILLGLTFTSCSNDDEQIATTTPLGNYENGILISNEGNFFGGNASVSFVSNDFATVENDVFNNVNDMLLGDTAQSIAFDGGLAYIVVNVSKKVEVVNRYTFESVGTVDTGLTNPRYMVVTNGKGYITDWGDGSDATDDFIAVIDLETYTIESTIPVAEGPEQIIANGSTIYVSHKGGFSSNNIVSKIDATSSVVNTITVNDNPDEMAFDASGNLLVLCEGRIIYNSDFSEIIGHTQGAITKIDVNSNAVLSNLNFNLGDHPRSFALNSGSIYYYVSGGVYKVDVLNSGLPIDPLFTESLYGSIVVKDNKLYSTKTDFSAGTGSLLVFDLSSNTLIETKTLKVGASKVYFN